MAAWADIIGDLMKDAGISQRELVRRSGVGRSAIRRMLAGGDPTMSVVESVLDALQYDLDAIPRTLTADKTPFKNCKAPAVRKLTDPTVKAVVRFGYNDR